MVRLELHGRSLITQTLIVLEAWVPYDVLYLGLHTEVRKDRNTNQNVFEWIRANPLEGKKRARGVIDFDMSIGYIVVTYFDKADLKRHTHEHRYDEKPVPLKIVHGPESDMGSGYYFDHKTGKSGVQRVGKAIDVPTVVVTDTETGKIIKTI